MSDCPTCPICQTSCDIAEEDLIDADCGACGSVTIHVHCKEKYCRQQGIPKGQYKGYTCPQCTRAKVSAQHHRQRDKRKKAASAQDKSGAGQQVSVVEDDTPKKQPIYDVDALVTAVLEDCQSDPTTLQPLRHSFKRLLQIQRVFKAEEEQLVNVWKPFSKRNIRKHYEALRGHQQPAYVQATSLLKLTSQASVDGEGEDVQKKRQEVAEHLFQLIPSALLEELDANQDYGRCQPLYDDVVGGLDSLSRQCEAARQYLERLRKSLPAQVVELDEGTQERMWPWCDVEESGPHGVVLCLANAGNTSDEHQLRSPPFYVGGVPWTVRFYKTRPQGAEQAHLAAYLDASHALRENPAFEKQVTFTFTIRRLANPRSDPLFRKEATFVFKKDSDNRGWRECAPASAAEDGRLLLSVEVREGAVATENMAIKVKLEGCAEVRFKVKHNTGLQKLMESYCTRQHLRPEYVTFTWADGKASKPKPVEGDTTPSDLGMSGDVETIVAVVKDPEVEIIMKRANVGVLEAAEAMEKCAYQPRKALQILASMQQAKAKAEATRKAEEDGAKKSTAEAAKPKAFAETPLVISSNFAPADKPKATPKAQDRKADAKPAEDKDESGESQQQAQPPAQQDSGGGATWGKESLSQGLSQGSGGLSQDDPGLSQGSDSATPAPAPAPAPAAGKASKGKGDDGEGFEEVKGKKKAAKKNSQDAGAAAAVAVAEAAAAVAESQGGGKQPFGGRKVFIGGTADKDHDELKEHFGQFGEVASVEVLKERDGAYRGFAFVTFYDIKAAQGLLDVHHTYLGNVRMEAKPCVHPRGELEVDRKIEAILGTSAQPDPRAPHPAFGSALAALPELPTPTASAWGSGPPAVKREVSGPAALGRETSGPPPGLGRDTSWRREDVDLTEWKQAETDFFPAIGSLGDMFDPEQPALPAAALPQPGGDSSAGAGAGWDTACSSMDTPVPLGLESMLDFDDDENICSICFENLANACLKPCDHSFCTVCVKQLKKQAVFLPIEGVRCPSCRATVKDFILPSTGTALPTTSASKTAWGSSAATAAAGAAPPAIQTSSHTPQAATATPTAATTPAQGGPAALSGTPMGQASSLWGGGGGGGGGGDIWGGGMGQVGGSFAMPGAVGGEGGSLWGGFGGADPLFARGAVGGNTWGGFGGVGDGAEAGGGLWSGGAGGGLGGMFSMPTGGSMEGDDDRGGMGVGGGLGGLGGGLWGDEKPMGSGMAKAAEAAPAVRDPDALDIKVKFTDDREVLVVAKGNDTGRQLRLKIKELTGTPMSCQRLFFQGKVLEHADLLRDKKVVSGVVVNCFPREAQPGEEEQLLRDMPSPAFHAPAQPPPPAPAPTQPQHAPIGRSGGVGGVGALMESVPRERSGLTGGGQGGEGGRGEGRKKSPERRAGQSEDERTEDDASEQGLSQDQGLSLSQSSKGLSQDHARHAALPHESAEWEAVATKKKKGRSKGGTDAKASAGAAQPAAAAVAGAQAAAAEAGKGKTRAQFFGLWVGNVHSEVVEQEEFKAAFEFFGELCNAKAHGVPPINILPPSSSAFVNFCRYEDADAARTALQGKTVGCTGPLRINASDLMQKYEEEVVIPARKRAETARSAWGPDDPLPGPLPDAAATVWSAAPAPAPNLALQREQAQREQAQREQAQREQAQREAHQRAAAAAAAAAQQQQQQQQALLAAQREAQAQRERELVLLQQQQMQMHMSAADRARAEQEKRDHELAIKMQRQEQYEAANAALIAQAQRRKQPVNPFAPAPAPRDPGPGPSPSWAAAGPGPGAGGLLGMPLPSTPVGDETPRSAPRTLMDHLPSQLRGPGGEAAQAAQRQPNAWGVSKLDGHLDGVLPLPPDDAAGWGATDMGALGGSSVWGGGLNGRGGPGAAWGAPTGGEDAGWSANGEDEWEQAPARGRKGRGRGRGQGNGSEDVMFGSLE